MQVPKQTLQTQRSAASPRHSAWVEANAGSGKTHVLTGRVIHLLLSGVRPASLLCLTFTEAAAASMSNRIFARLREWARHDDEALDLDLERLLGRPPLAGERITARRLFAQAIETPGGLKIQTVHAFAERLLHQFPLEAGIWPDFKVLDEAEASRLRQDAIATVLARSATDADLGEALTRLQAHLSNFQIDRLLQNLLSERETFAQMINGLGGLLRARTNLKAELPGGTAREVSEIDAEVLLSPFLPPEDWQKVGQWMGEDGGKQLAKRGAGFLAAAKMRNTLGARDAYLAAFQDSKGGFLSPKSLGDKPFKLKHPELYDRLCAERERLQALSLERHERVRFEVTDALYPFGAAIVVAFAEAKAAQHALDFADLILRTRQLLQDSGAAWIHYKLDQGVDHILLDEAQDTSPDQWEIVDRLVGEFFAGKGARDHARTLFAVGDKKQSIYRFQGVDPALFQAKKDHYQSRFSKAELAFKPLELTLSFRSLPKIMAAVEQIFASEKTTLALGGGEPVPPHQALPDRRGGRIELWPVIEGEKRTGEVDYWQAPDEEEEGEKPVVVLARQIASTIKQRIAAGERSADGKRLTPKDFLILVRSRGVLFEALIQALKRAEVPLAGADRLVLTDHLAVKDLIALGKFTYLPTDDLNLAALLKSPLLGLTEDELQALATKRRGRLVEALFRQAAQSPRLALISNRLKLWQSEARHLSPFEFFQQVLGRDGGLKALLGRLSFEAEEAIQVFLDQALAAEAKGCNSLRRFLDQLERHAPEVKRNVDSGRDEVRVMTVHHAKGLEAKVVFLADTTRIPSRVHTPSLLPMESAKGSILVWSQNSEEPEPAIQALREAHHEAEMREYYRLLYVALTRAEEQVVITGALRPGIRQAADGSWYALCEEALQADLVQQDLWGQTVWLWRPEAVSTASKEEEKMSEGGEELPLPDWLFAAPSKPGPRPRKRSPSKHQSAQQDQEKTTSQKLIRGTKMHQILEQWVKVPDAQRSAALQVLVDSATLPTKDKQKIHDHLLKIWHSETLGWTLAHSGLSEVPIFGHLKDDSGQAIEVQGIIDRLIRHQGELWLLDYKSGAVRPNPDYDRQLALYRLLLEQSGETLPIRPALLWLDHGTLSPLSEAAYKEALADLDLAHYI